ncbi:unnamed protein product [Ixodes pacificus]
MHFGVDAAKALRHCAKEAVYTQGLLARFALGACGSSLPTTPIVFLYSFHSIRLDDVFAQTPVSLFVCRTTRRYADAVVAAVKYRLLSRSVSVGRKKPGVLTCIYIYSGQPCRCVHLFNKKKKSGYELPQCVLCCFSLSELSS